MTRRGEGHYYGGGSFVSIPADFRSASSMPFGDINDPLGSIAERLGQLRGKYEFDKYRPSASPFALQIMQEETRPLQTLMDAYLKQLRLKSESEEEALRQQRNQKSSGGGASGLGGSSGGSSGGISFGDDIRRPPEREPYFIMDPYKKAREASIEAARKYLSLQNPHMGLMRY